MFRVELCTPEGYPLGLFFSHWLRGPGVTGTAWGMPGRIFDDSTHAEVVAETAEGLTGWPVRVTVIPAHLAMGGVPVAEMGCAA